MAKPGIVHEQVDAQRLRSLHNGGAIGRIGQIGDDGFDGPAIAPRLLGHRGQPGAVAAGQQQTGAARYGAGKTAADTPGGAGYQGELVAWG